MIIMDGPLDIKALSKYVKKYELQLSCDDSAHSCQISASTYRAPITRTGQTYARIPHLGRLAYNKNMLQILSFSAHNPIWSNMVFQYTRPVLCGFCGVWHLPIQYGIRSNTWNCNFFFLLLKCINHWKLQNILSTDKLQQK